MFTNNFLIHTVDNDVETFNTLKEAQDFLVREYSNDVEGYHPDIESMSIYEMRSSIVIEEVSEGVYDHKFIGASSINELAKEIHENNKAKGFYDDEKNIGEMLCLIHSEVSEALECDRNGKYAQIDSPEFIEDGNTIRMDLDLCKDFIIWEHGFRDQVKDNFEDELADIMIRVMDLAAFKGIDLEWHIKAKMKYNSMRPHKHGKKY